MTMASSTTTTKEDSLRRARSLLGDISSRKRSSDAFQDRKQAADTLLRTIHLLESLQSELVKEATPLDPSSAAWKVLKALLELLVRLGILPHLQAGVGAQRDTRQDDGRSVSSHFSALSISFSSLQSSSAPSGPGISVLSTCTDLLSSFFWTTPNHPSMSQASPSSEPAFLQFEDSFATPQNANCTFSGDFGIAEYRSQRNQTLDMDASSSHDMSRLPTDANSSDETQVLPFLSTRELAMKFFTWDLMAAYLQLGFGPSESDIDIRDRAKSRLKFMLEYLSVQQMVPASFLLLSQKSPPPPPWMSSELGKCLSKLVMRGGGLLTVLEELVGRVTKGSVESYDKVAGHLAKVPKSVATADEYLQSLCSQLLPLLLLKHKFGDEVWGEISLAALNNIFHTSVSLACKICALNAKLGTSYLIKPMIGPLLALNSMQKSLDVSGCLSSGPANGEQCEGLVTEKNVVDSLVQLSALLTAGSQGSSVAREVILLETKDVALVLLKLYFQLDPKIHNNLTTTPERIRNLSSNDKNFKLGEKGLREGFLKKGLGLSNSGEQGFDNASKLSKLRSSLSDIVMVEVNQSVDSALPFVLPFLLEHTLDVVRWPEEEGEVWETLQSKRFQSKSKTMYLSRLLMMVENWPLVVALMGKLLHLILNAPWSQLDNGHAEGNSAAEAFRHLQDIEELTSEAGSKALEEDIFGAASLVKALLDDERVLVNSELLELVLHMVYSVLRGIHLSKENQTYMNAHGSILIDLLSLLQGVCSNPLVDKMCRQMSFTLTEEVSVLCRDCKEQP